MFKWIRSFLGIDQPRKYRLRLVYDDDVHKNFQKLKAGIYSEGEVVQRALIFYDFLVQAMIKSYDILIVDGDKVVHDLQLSEDPHNLW